MLRRDSAMTHRMLRKICSISGLLYTFTFVDCIPLSTISDFCGRNHSLAGQASESWMSSALLPLGPEIEIRSHVPSTIITLVKNSATVFHIIRPMNNASLLATLEELSGRFTHDENVVAMEPERTVTLIRSPVSHQDIRSFLIKNLPLSAIPIDREVYLVHLEPENSASTVVLTEVYTIQDVTMYNRVPVAECDGCLKENELLRIAHRRSNLQGKAIKVAAQVDPAYPDAITVTSENGTIRFISGYNLLASRDLQSMLNFTYVAVVGSGWIGCNGTRLTGMGAQIMDNEADLSASYNSAILCRMQKVYFLPALSYGEGYVFYRDDAAAPSDTAMLKPFGYKLWILIFLAWSILWIVYTVFFLTSKKLNLTDDQSPCFIFFSVTCQGHPGDPPNATSLRIILFASAVTGYLIYCLYNARVIAFLSTPSTYIHTVDDLPLNGYFTYAESAANHYATSLFSNEEYQKALVENSRLHFRDFDSSVSSVFDRTTKYAFLCNDDDFYATGIKLNITEDVLCGVSSKKNANAGRVKVGMVLRKGSPLRELLTQKTMKIVETGLAYRYKLIHIKHTRPVCDYYHNRRSAVAIKFKQCTSAFMVVLVGMVLSAFVLILEKLIAHFRLSVK